MSAEKPMVRFESVSGGIDDCNAGRVYQGPERRAGWHDPSNCINMRIVEDRFDRGSARMDSIDQRIERIERSQEANSETLAEIRDILQLGKSFFRLADIIGRVVKWVAVIAGPVVGLWVAIKGGDNLK